MTNWKNGIGGDGFVAGQLETVIEFNARIDRVMNKILCDAGLEVPDLWEGFDIPEHRKDIDNVSNARWILRNLAIRNSNHPRLSEVLDRAIETVKGEGR